MVMPSFSFRRITSTPHGQGRWMIVAPHADDETLGCGALIAAAARQGTLGCVVILTDGSGSHPHADEQSRARLIALRQAEARLAVRRLTGGRDARIVFLDWPDADPFQPGSCGFDASRRHLAALCRRLRIDRMAVTAQHEPHCDHVAACRLARAVAETAMRPVGVLEYVVWAPEPPGPGYRAHRTAPVATGLRNQALAAHRSQTTPLVGEGFRLSAAKMKMSAFDTLYEKVSRHARAR